MRSDRTLRFSSALPTLIAILMAIALFTGTPWGLGMSRDSITYFRAAKFLYETGDFTALPSHWPPLFPILVAVATNIFHDIEL